MKKSVKVLTIISISITVISLIIALAGGVFLSTKSVDMTVNGGEYERVGGLLLLMPLSFGISILYIIIALLISAIICGCIWGIYGLIRLFKKNKQIFFIVVLVVPTTWFILWLVSYLPNIIHNSKI